jgi:hypothetical protein
MALVVAVCLGWLVLVMLAELVAFFNAPARPVGLVVFQIRSNSTMADVLVYRVSVGPVVDADVVERRLTVTVNGETKDDSYQSYSADTTDLGEISVPQGANVLLTFVDVDDAGNRSEPASFEFVASDTLPPAQPSALGVTLVREEKGEEPVA